MPIGHYILNQLGACHFTWQNGSATLTSTACNFKITSNLSPKELLEFAFDNNVKQSLLIVLRVDNIKTTSRKLWQKMDKGGRHASYQPLGNQLDSACNPLSLSQKADV